MEPKIKDWSALGFNYIKTDKRFFAKWQNGQWNKGELVENDKITISDSSTVLHYGQSCFEGLKAYTTKDNKIVLFRPYENAKRFNASADRIMMPQVPEEMFVQACCDVVKANLGWVPPYGTGATLYIRPFLIGIGDNIGLKPAPEFLFGVFCMPVGSYFKGGMKPVKFMISKYDRAAPNGTGAAKVGGNYAGSLIAHEEAVKNGYADCIYLDPKTHTNIEEVGAANFFGITADNKFVTPTSPSILPSITRRSLVHIAKEMLGLTVEEREIPINSIDQFTEAGACGTAAVITPIGGISYQDKLHTFYADGKEVGPITKKLYDTLTGIQFGEIPAPKSWIHPVA